MLMFGYAKCAHWIGVTMFAMGVIVALAGCGAALAVGTPAALPAATSVALPIVTPPPTATVLSPTETPVPPPATPLPTHTSIPPTAMASATAVPPTRTPASILPARPALTPSGAPQLTLREIGRHKEGSSTVISYQVLATSFPAGKMYILARLPLGGQPQVFDAQFLVDASGNMISTEKPLDAYSFDIGQFARGEALLIAVAATDKSASAAAKAIPFPIEAKGNGACHLTVELASAKGDAFAVSAGGFIPNEALTYTSQSEGEVSRTPTTAQADGGWATVATPAVVGKDSGTVSIALEGAACTVSVQFAWGKDALKGQ